MPILTYADFDYYLNGAGIGAIQDLINIIDGTGSLLIARTSGAAAVQANWAPLTPTYTQGLAHGALQCVFRRTVLSTASQTCILLCMQDQRNLTASGTAYGLAWQPVSGILRLLKIANGLANSGAHTLLATADLNGEYPGATQLMLRLEWAAMTESVALLVSVGLATTGEDLALVLTATDTSSPLTSHVTEGAGYYDSSGLNFQVEVDRMTLRELS